MKFTKGERYVKAVWYLVLSKLYIYNVNENGATKYSQELISHVLFFKCLPTLRESWNIGSPLFVDFNKSKVCFCSFFEMLTYHRYHSKYDEECW
jgi:hypothetical protein